MLQWLKSNLFLFFLLLLDALVVLAHFLLKNKYGFFDLDGEGNLNSLFSGFQLFFIAAITGGQFLILQKIGERGLKKWLWLLVGLSFTYLGLDEIMAIHERAGFVFNNLSGLTGWPGASFNWIIYFSPLIILVLILYFRLFFSIWQKNKKAAALILTGIILMIGSLLAESIGGQVIYPRGLQTGNFHLYWNSIIIEETIELMSVSFFLAGVFIAVKKSFNQHFEIRQEK